MRQSSVPRFDFRTPVSYNSEAKRRFHSRARCRLRQLAAALGLSPAAYDLRSNRGGIAVSGEVTLHADRLYVQVSQPATGSDTGILFRTCNGRTDYVGGRNNFASLDLLNAPEALAHRIRAACPVGAMTLLRWCDHTAAGAGESAP
jgi:hypothetical protein